MTHHNIVNLLDVGMDGDSRDLVLEYVTGQTLQEVSPAGADRRHPDDDGVWQRL